MMEQRSRDTSIRKRELSAVEPWEKNFPRKRRSGRFVGQGDTLTVNQSTQNSTISVADSAVAGAMRSLGLARSDQRSAALSMDVDYRQNKGDDGSDQLSTLAKQFEVSSEELETFQKFQRDSQDSPEGLSGLSYEVVSKIAEGFKQQADTIGKMCTGSPVKGKSYLYNEWCKECRESKQAYNECKDESSCGQGDLIKALTRYQQAVVLFSKFIIDSMKDDRGQFTTKEKAEFKEKEVKFQEKVELVKQFIAIYPDIFDSAKKQDTLEKYRAMFEKCGQKLKEFQDEHNEKKQNIVLLGTKVNWARRDIVALGNIIKKDYPQSYANKELLEKINQHSTNYAGAMDDCQKARLAGDLAPFLMSESDCLSNMIKAAMELNKAYSELAEGAMKRKGPAVGSPVTDHRYQIGESDSEAEMRHKQIQADKQYAQNLVKQEHEALKPGSSEASMDIDSDSESGSKGSRSATDRDSAHDRRSEINEEEKNLGAVSIGESDKKGSFFDEGDVSGLKCPDEGDITGPKRPEDLEELNRIDEVKYSLEMRKVAQSKLAIYMRDNTYLSTGQIREVGCQLSQQLIDIRNNYLELCGQGNMPQDIKADPGKIYTHFNTPNQEPSKRWIEVLQKYQQTICEHLKKHLTDSKYGKEFRQFNEQVEHFSKLEGEQFKRNIEAYKAEVGARELGSLFLKKQGGFSWAHTTFAVAYMSNHQTGEIHGIISANNSVSERSIREVVEKFKEKYPNEQFTPVKHEQVRHAEEVLLDYAKKHDLEIYGIGASRKFCSNCSKMLKELVKPQALGQTLLESDKGEISSKHWKGVKTGGRSDSLQREKREIDDKDIYSLDDEQKIFPVRRKLECKKLHIKFENTIDGKKVKDEVTLEKMPTWLTDEYRERLSSSVIKSLRGLLEPPYRGLPIKVDLSRLCIFENTKNGELHGVNEIIEMRRKFTKEGINISIMADMWNKVARTHGSCKKSYITIKHKNWGLREIGKKDEIEWHFSNLYALYKERENQIVITDRLKSYSIDEPKNVGADRWTVIKKIGTERKKKEIPVLIIEPGKPETFSYDKMQQSEVPGRYLKYKDGHRFYLPLSLTYVVDRFFKIAEEQLAEKGEQIKIDKGRLSQAIRGKIQFGKGRQLGEWRLENYISPSLPEVSCAEWKGLKIEHKKAKQFFNKNIETNAKNIKVSYKAFVRWVLDDKNQNKNLKSYWTIIRPERGLKQIIVWKPAPPTQSQ